MARLTRASFAAAAAAKDEKCLVQSQSDITVEGTPIKAESNPALVSQTVTPSPRKGKRKRLESGTATSLQAPSYLQGMSPLPTRTITRKSIQRLIESRILSEVDYKDAGFKRVEDRKIDTRTLGGWCLVDALFHCGKASNGVLAPLILKHGPPRFYLDHIKKSCKAAEDDENAERTTQTSSTSCASEDYPAFRALCRTVAGQQLAGAAAETIWRRLVEVVTGNTEEGNRGDPSFSDLQSFTPQALLSVVEKRDKLECVDSKNGVLDTDRLRKPAGLSKAKCDCILEIARSFQSGSLSEAFLMEENNDAEIRSRLLSIKGLGPWSVDMFLMFQCHRSNVLPIGDLAVRNGTAVLWKANRSLCAKKDATAITEYHSPFEPYRSISSYYMYKVADATKGKKKLKSKKY